MSKKQSNPLPPKEAHKPKPPPAPPKKTITINENPNVYNGVLIVKNVPFTIKIF